jgi:hypothetical protein
MGPDASGCSPVPVPLTSLKGSCLAHTLEADDPSLSEIEAFEEEVPLEQLFGRDPSRLEGSLVPCSGPLLRGGKHIVQRWLSCGHLISFEGHEAMIPTFAQRVFRLSGITTSLRSLCRLQRSRAAHLAARPPHPASPKLTSFAKAPHPSPARGEGIGQSKTAALADGRSLDRMNPA